MQSWSPAGLPNIPYVQWGSHFAHFFSSGNELRDVLVPYFKAGLENNERCLWVTGRGLDAQEARSVLSAAVPDLDERERNQQITIADADDWYKSGKPLHPQALLRSLLDCETQSLDRGFAGLRTNGNCSWVTPDQWNDFLHYEQLVQEAVRSRRS